MPARTPSRKKTSPPTTAKQSAALPVSVPAVGKKAPDFTARTSSGQTLRLRDLRGHKVVLYFYPKDATSGCTRQACGFRDRHDGFRSAGAIVLGVSPDSAVSHAKFRAQEKLPFELLVDADHAIAGRYGVWREKSMYGRTYFGVVRSHFVIDESGTLLEARVPVSPDESPEAALAAVRQEV